jgi:hypothetical protein
LAGTDTYVLHARNASAPAGGLAVAVYVVFASGHAAPLPTLRAELLAGGANDTAAVATLRQRANVHAACGLVDDATYRMTIAAGDAVGLVAQAPAISLTAVSPPAAPPLVPTYTAITPTSVGLAWAWCAGVVPGQDGGSPLTGFRV